MGAFKAVTNFSINFKEGILLIFSLLKYLFSCLWYLRIERMLQMSQFMTSLLFMIGMLLKRWDGRAFVSVRMVLPYTATVSSIRAESS